jgi:hypothetical protein
MTTDPIDNPRKKIPADILAKIEAFHEQIMDPEPGDPILSRADSPRLDSLQRWRDDAVRLGFDPAEVWLVFDGDAFGIQIPDALLDAVMDEFW